ncbi:MAG TPA: response regulator [Phycisphaerae bacterium]|nr:response regulator [Phycisphaerae bacterium]HRY66416.1 response regulator [Phycisphaerae bacterium]HSA25876.1 response regulator [Phycisphaerae bacterium]
MSHDVLIVDDSVTIRQMVKKTLDIAGLNVGEVYEASNGIEALAQLNDHPVAVMLVDINMPTMNGIQLLTRMRGNRRLKDIPIVIVSTEGSRQRIAELESIGAFGYVRKPFHPEQLRDVLKPLLGVKDHATNENDAEGALF